MNQYLLSLLKQFGHTQFRVPQQEIIETIIAKQDLVGILPTGSGKSLCFQLPALHFKRPTLVISPLIALMSDQINALEKKGIPVATLNHTTPFYKVKDILNHVAQNRIKLLYIAPERFNDPAFKRWFLSSDPDHIVIDEAHCISQWGKQFRPAYRQLGTILKQLPQRPIISAFTASATQEVIKDIMSRLNLNEPKLFQKSPQQNHIFYHKEQTIQKEITLLNYLNRFKGKSGIIYTATRQNCDHLNMFLKRNGFKSERYHSGLPPFFRTKIQNDFITNRCEIIVATTAFGMGIDKPDVRYVIHYTPPFSLENYLQESGRAGRDGAPAISIILYTPGDLQQNHAILSGDHAQKDIDQMTYFLNHSGCLTQPLYNYFQQTKGKRCNHCSYCTPERFPF